jgi:hypothetical protein
MNFKQAFFEINGREPTDEQTKHALAVARIVKEADLDPILLVYLADAQAQAARERGLAQMRQTTKEAVERLRNALPSVDDAKKSIGALAGVQTALHNLAVVARETMPYAMVLGTLLGLVWAMSLGATWKVAYDRGHDDAHEGNHQIVCADLEQYVSGMSAFWRGLGYPKAAEKLGQSYDRRCR